MSEKGQDNKVSTMPALIDRLESVTRQLTMILRTAQGQKPNYFRAMVRLLRAYPKMRALVEDKDEYMTLREHDHSLSVAPPAGAEVKDEATRREERLEERRNSYETTLRQFEVLNRIIGQFRDDPRFITIQMYDFNEDYEGHPRESKEAPSWDEIETELRAYGKNYTERTLRTWRKDMIQGMAVLMFGAEGALSLETPWVQGEAGGDKPRRH